MGAQRLQAAGGFRHRGGDLRRDADIAQVRAEGDPQPGDAAGAAAAPRLPQIIHPFRRQRPGIAAVGPADGVQHQGRVRHGARHRPDMGKRAVDTGRPGGHAPEAGLEADHAAEGGRDAHRAAAVAAQRQGAAAAGQGGRRPAAGAAGRHAQIPGVAGGAVERAVGHALPAHLRRRRHAQEDAAGLAQAGDRRRVLLPGLARVHGLRSQAGGPAADAQHVLDAHRHAVQRPQRLAPAPAPLAGGGLGAHRVVVAMAEGVEIAVDLVDAGQRGGRRFDRREVAGAIARRQFQRRQAGRAFGRAHARSSSAVMAAVPSPPPAHSRAPPSRGRPHSARGPGAKSGAAAR